MGLLTGVLFHCFSRFGFWFKYRVLHVKKTKRPPKKLACLMPLGPAQSSKKSSMNRVRMANRLEATVPVSRSLRIPSPAGAVASATGPVELVAPSSVDDESARSDVTFSRSV